MPGLKLKITTAGRQALVNAKQTGTQAVTIAAVGLSSAAFVANAELTALSSEIKRSVSPYLHAVMVLTYNLRLRGAEVTDLTDARAGEQGILATRQKGSRDNVTLWNGELRSAWAWLIEYRRRTMAAHERPIPLKPEQRRLVVSQSGTPLTKSALDSAWQRMTRLAIREGVIEEAQRFSLHGLKHRGITDTEGTLTDKQEAAGHKTQEMTQRYSHTVPVVKPPRWTS